MSSALLPPSPPGCELGELKLLSMPYASLAYTKSSPCLCQMNTNNKRQKGEPGRGLCLCPRERKRGVREGWYCFASFVQMCEALLLLIPPTYKRGTETSFFNAFWPWRGGSLVLDPAVVWPDSGMEFVHPLPLFLKNRIESSLYFGPRSREEDQTEGGERWAGRSGRKHTPTPVAQGTMKRVKDSGGSLVLSQWRWHLK